MTRIIPETPRPDSTGRRRRRLVTAAGTAVLAAGLTGLTAAASAATVHGAASIAVKQVSYQDYTFQVPVGIYIGGPEEACDQPSLTAGWVSTQAATGWAFIPSRASAAWPGKPAHSPAPGDRVLTVAIPMPRSQLHKRLN